MSDRPHPTGANRPTRPDAPPASAPSAGLIPPSGLNPPAEVVIGLDVGTTAVKCSAFGLSSPWLTTVVREYPLLHPHPGWEVQNPEVISAAV